MVPDTCPIAHVIDVCAEFGQSHGGDLDTAMTQAAVARDAGCAWVKWQTFRPDRLASPNASRYWDAALGGNESQLATFEANGMLGPADWKVLAQHCADIGIKFLSSPFDIESVGVLVDAGAQAIKIASGEITHRQLLERVAETGLPVFMSTGASTLGEVSQALEWLLPTRPTLLACTLAYPTADNDAELGRIVALQNCYPRHRVGYSDHTLRTDTALAAVVLGATVLEKHCTLDEDGTVPDDKMALNPGRLRQYVAYAQLGARMRGTGRLVPTEAERAARAGARRSLHAARGIEAGEVFRLWDFACLRPAGPFAPGDAHALVGKRAACHIAPGTQIGSEHVEF